MSFTYDTHLRLDTETAAGHVVAFGYDGDGLATSAGALAIARDANNGGGVSTTLGAITTSYGMTAFGELVRMSASDAVYRPYQLLLHTSYKTVNSRYVKIQRLGVFASTQRQTGKRSTKTAAS